MVKATKYILVTEVKSTKENFLNCIKYWKELRENELTKFYVNQENFNLIELRAFSNLESASQILLDNKLIYSDKNLLSFFSSDLHQEILEHKEEVITQNSLLPQSKYLQLRHIEVPLAIYDEYQEWRRQTIFNHVKKLNTVESFVAYHSLLSTSPGVMFVCGFSCSIDDYMQGFSNDAYKEIVRQAGDRYIAGGEKGLYTKIYEAI